MSSGKAALQHARQLLDTMLPDADFKGKLAVPVPELQATDEEIRAVAGLLLEHQQHSHANPRNGDGDHTDAAVCLPIEWVIDVADQRGGCSIGTAYWLEGLQDTTPRLRVAIPDKQEPTWEGEVPLQPSSVKLLESCDGDTMALFKRCMLKSTIAVDWCVEWSEESLGRQQGHAALWCKLGGFLLVETGPPSAPRSRSLEENHRQSIPLDDDPPSPAWRRVDISSHRLRLISCGASSRQDFEELMDSGAVGGAEEDSQEGRDQGDAQMQASHEDDQTVSDVSESRREREDAQQLQEALQEHLSPFPLADDELDQLPMFAWPTSDLQLTSKGQLATLLGVVREAQSLVNSALSLREDASVWSRDSHRRLRELVFQGDLFSGDALLLDPRPDTEGEALDRADRALCRFEDAVVCAMHSRVCTRGAAVRVTSEIMDATRQREDAGRAKRELTEERSQLARELSDALDEEEELQQDIATLKARRERLRKQLHRARVTSATSSDSERSRRSRQSSTSPRALARSPRSPQREDSLSMVAMHRGSDEGAWGDDESMPVGWR